MDYLDSRKTKVHKILRAKYLNHELLLAAELNGFEKGLEEGRKEGREEGGWITEEEWYRTRTLTLFDQRWTAFDIAGLFTLPAETVQGYLEEAGRI